MPATHARVAPLSHTLHRFLHWPLPLDQSITLRAVSESDVRCRASLGTARSCARPLRGGLDPGVASGVALFSCWGSRPAFRWSGLRIRSRRCPPGAIGIQRQRCSPAGRVGHLHQLLSGGGLPAAGRARGVCVKYTQVAPTPSLIDGVSRKAMSTPTEVAVSLGSLAWAPILGEHVHLRP